MEVEQSQRKRAAVETEDPGRRCGVCQANRIMTKREDGLEQCPVCSNVFDQEDFMMAHRDPAVAAEKQEQHRNRVAQGKRRRGNGNRARNK